MAETPRRRVGSTESDMNVQTRYAPTLLGNIRRNPSRGRLA
jgi:hypothetical protein